MLITGKKISTSRSKLKSAVSTLCVDSGYSKKSYGAEKHQYQFSMHLEFEMYFFIRKFEDKQQQKGKKIKKIKN